MDRPRADTTRDEEFRLRLAAGDDNALGEVYDLYGRYVHGLALRVTGDSEAARDVTQEVFTELWTRPLAFDPRRGSLRSWVAMLAHRRAVDLVRKEVSQRKTAQASATRGEAPNGADPPADEQVIAADVALQVKEVVALLPKPLREAIDLTYYRGNTCRHAATVLGIPEGTFKSRLRRAMSRIEAELKQNGLVE